MSIIDRVDWWKEEKDRMRVDRGDEIREMIADFEQSDYPIDWTSETRVVERKGYHR